MWWGTCGLILIEGTAFALAIGMYLYYWTHATQWPPGHTAPPRLLWGTLNTVILLASAVPNQLTRNAAERVDLRATQRWFVVALIFAIAFNVVRAFEFTGLNVKWNQDAYGSIVWLLLGLHTTHIVTDVLDSAVLAALLFIGPVEEKRFVDVSENSIYWYFVVLTWLPIYAVIYLAPRFL
jgi:heme/copper-type cytochrome/quinol oxidase subunit 3